MNKTTSRSVLPFFLALAITLTSEAGVLFDHATAPWNALRDA